MHFYNPFRRKGKKRAKRPRKPPQQWVEVWGWQEPQEEVSPGG
jgi:hypothetical protein